MSIQTNGPIPSEIFENVGSQSNFIRNVKNLTIAELIELYAYAEAIVETVREPLIILDKDFRVKSANKGFFKTFHSLPRDTIGKIFSYSEMANGTIPI